MFKKFLRINLAALALTAVSGTLSSAWAQSVTVIEYYNKPLDAYFITGRVAEQLKLDASGDFLRTGMTFQAVEAASAPAGMIRICRFYISSVSTFTSSHFYGREDSDCESIRSQNLPGFAWEGYDFAVERPINGVCGANKTAIYRSFRSTAGGKTGNHRYSTSYESYLAIGDYAYAAEGLELCATSTTDAAQISSSACGTFYYPASRIGYKSVDSDGKNDRWTRSMVASKTTFNSAEAQPVTDLYISGATRTFMISEAPDTWIDLGSVNKDASGVLQVSHIAPTVVSRQMAIGDTIVIDRYDAYSPIQSFGSPRQTGQISLIGVELVEVPAGKYVTCKFSNALRTEYGAIGRTDLRSTTTWVSPGIGVVKSVREDTNISGFGPVFPTTTTTIVADSVEHL